jgi:hypothetical protein
MLALRLTVRCCPPRIARIAIYLLDSFKPCIGYATVWLYVLAGKEVTQQYGCMCLQEKKQPMSTATPAFLRTHPLTNERVQKVKDALPKVSSGCSKLVPEEAVVMSNVKE